MNKQIQPEVQQVIRMGKCNKFVKIKSMEQEKFYPVIDLHIYRIPRYTGKIVLLLKDCKQVDDLPLEFEMKRRILGPRL